MDFTSGSVPPNQPSISKPMPPCPLPHDSQEDKEQLALQQFWHQQLSDVESNEAKPQQFLPGRIKKIMKADKNIKTISSEVPLLFAKACEVFAQELTFRAWILAQANKKRTIKPCDVTMAVKKDQVFNFLANVAHCGHDHRDDLNKGVNAGQEGNQVSQTSFIQNAVMNLEEMIERNMQQLIPPPPLPPYDLPSEVIQINPNLPNQSQTMMQPPCQPYYQSQSSQMVQPYLPSNQPEMMSPPYLPFDESGAMLPSYQPSNQIEKMQPPYPPHSYPFPYDSHPK